MTDKTAKPEDGGLFAAIPRWVFWAFAAVVAALSIVTLIHYPGKWIVYLLFTVLANALLFFGFRKGAIFFDTFIGGFLWLGFWMKLSVRVAFFGGGFHEAVGSFGGKGADFDHGLLVASCGFLGLLVASWVREKWLFSYRREIRFRAHTGVLEFYRRYRKPVLTLFLLFSLGISISNFVLGIYQRGCITRTILPFGLSGVYTWLILFGLSSVSAVVLFCEYSLKKRVPVGVVGISLLDCFFTNLSLLSRAMILNGSALLCGLFCLMKGIRDRKGLWSWIRITVVFGILFITSVFTVNYVRSANLSILLGEEYGHFYEVDVDMSEVRSKTAVLFLDRWVGMEGVLAVTGSSERGWDLFSRAWREVYAQNLSFYDTYLVNAIYADIDQTKVRHISLSGGIAFFYYPGSLPFLFFSLFVMGLMGGGLEWYFYKFGGGNLILCALLSQAVAYRFSHFGYLPSGSYLIFSALILNVLLIALANFVLVRWYSDLKNTPPIRK